MNTRKTAKTPGERVDELKQRVGEIEKMLQKKHVQLDGLDIESGFDYNAHKKPESPDKQPKTKGKEYPSQDERNEARSYVEDRSEEEIPYSDNDETEDMQKEEKAGAMWRPPVPNVNPIKPKKNKNSVWLEDANGASLHDSQSLNVEEENFEKKTIKEQVETISKDFENWRTKYGKTTYELDDLEYTVSEIYTDFYIILKSFRVDSASHIGMELEDIEELVQQLRKELDKLREKRSSP